MAKTLKIKSLEIKRQEDADEVANWAEIILGKEGSMKIEVPTVQDEDNIDKVGISDLFQLGVKPSFRVNAKHLNSDHAAIISLIEEYTGCTVVKGTAANGRNTLTLTSSTSSNRTAKRFDIKVTTVDMRAPASESDVLITSSEMYITSSDNDIDFKAEFSNTPLEFFSSVDTVMSVPIMVDDSAA